MVRISEIIKRTSNSDLLDSLIDKPLSDIIYHVYDKLIRLTNNYELLSYDIEPELLADMKHQVRIIHNTISIFPPNAIARQMVEEMYRYFELYSE